MKEGFFKGIKNLFNSKPKIITTQNKEMNIEERVISFGEKNAEDEQMNFQEKPDLRYEKIENYPSLKDLGLKKDEIQAGQTVVLKETKLVYTKLDDEKYDETELIITNYKICIKCGQNDYLFIGLGKIDKLTKYITNQTIYKIMIQLKDGRKFKLRISSENGWKRVYEKIGEFAFVTSKSHFFAFRHFEFNKEFEEKLKGWRLFDLEKEYARMGLKPMEHTEDLISQFHSDFKILDNREGKICSTYPPFFIVPSRMPYDSLVRCSKFRTKERMPALTYAYEYQPGKFSCIYRSSQCKSGVGNNRSVDDEMMLRVIGNHKINPRGSHVHENENMEVKKSKIYDARGYIAALGNRLQGKGYESEENYPHCQLVFLNIPNIHAVREAYYKVVEGVMGDDSKFFKTLAESKWYEFIFLILLGALDLAKNMLKGTNNLVHCSDGWDRTSQLCALAQIMLDPFYRTIKGFEIIIEKDWMYFGHQFAKRIGQGMNNPGNEDKSQIFLQFLDCVTQLMYQFPSQFQFNYRFIQQIGEQTYNHLYGNFLCNCHLEMVKHSIFTRTVSLWSKLKKDQEIYLNPFYLPSKINLLSLDPHQKNMRLWKEHFFQHFDIFNDAYDIYSCNFTEDNLQIMHKHLNKEKQLLEEKYNENLDIIQKLKQQVAALKKQKQSVIQQISEQSQKRKQLPEIDEKQDIIEQNSSKQIIEQNQKGLTTIQQENKISSDPQKDELSSIEKEEPLICSKNEQYQQDKEAKQKEELVEKEKVEEEQKFTEKGKVPSELKISGQNEIKVQNEQINDIL